MPLEFHAARPYRDDDAAKTVVDLLKEEDEQLGLSEALVYYGYPRYRDDEDNLVSTQLLIASPEHGVVVLGTLNEGARSTDRLIESVEATEAFFAMVNAKLLANRALRGTPLSLSFPIRSFVFAPYLEANLDPLGNLSSLRSVPDLRRIFEHRSHLGDEVFAQLVATFDGSRSIPRPKKRDLSSLPSTSHGHLVARLEAELARFDVKQREGSLAGIEGPQRIRGLAGSGKTIVLTRKAALFHLDHPESSIAYTFHTKSLYQQVRRLITRFYRAEHDRDPEWDQVNVLHAWGGREDPGIYTKACEAHGVRPMTFSEARQKDPSSPFGVACRELMSAVEIQPVFDCIFIDEGQDFPPEFIRLCGKLARDMKFVCAYDELQSIFQTKAPDAAAIFGVGAGGKPNGKFERDIVLYKCCKESPQSAAFRSRSA